MYKIKTNKNDTPLRSVDECLEIKYDEFSYNKYFKRVCILEPDQSRERLTITDVSNDGSINRQGLLYCFVIDGVLVKVGCSATSIKARVQSYNCGKQNYRNSGTCSTTNYFILQTFLAINKPVDVYLYFTPVEQINVFGNVQDMSISPKPYENQILTHLKDRGMMPTLCTQT